MFTNTIELYKNIDIEDVGSQKRWESILSMAVTFERFVLNYSHHHLSESTPQIKIVSKSLGEYTCNCICSVVGRGSIIDNSFEPFFLRKIPARKT